MLYGLSVHLSVTQLPISKPVFLFFKVFKHKHYIR